MNRNLFRLVLANRVCGDRRPRGRSSSLRCGRSTSTPTAVHRDKAHGRNEGQTTKTTNGSHTFTGVPNTDKEANLQAAVAALREAGIEAVYGVCDVRRHDEVTSVIEEVLATFGQLDIVVNNAAGNFPVAISDLSAGGFKAVVDIDLLGTFNVSKTAYDLWLRDHGGAVVNISAAIQYRGMALQAHVVSAKAGIDALTRTCAIEWGPDGVRVNVVAPGAMSGTEGVSGSPAMISTAPSRTRCGVPDRPPRSPKRCYSWPATRRRT